MKQFYIVYQEMENSKPRIDAFLTWHQAVMYYNSVVMRQMSSDTPRVVHMRLHLARVEKDKAMVTWNKQP